jgi:DNA-binding NarL/FixJ family response regulator
MSMISLTQPITLVIADDHKIFRKGLTNTLIQYAPNLLEVVAEANNGEELLEAVEKYQPKVVITDIHMPKMDGRNASRLIKKRYSHVGVVALSYYNDENLIYEMFEEGINGFLSKNSDTDEMLQTIRAASKGEIYYSSNTSKALIKRIASGKYSQLINKHTAFSPTEFKIIKSICQQKTTREIASSLNLSIRTIEDHSKNIKGKMGVSNLVGIALYAIKHQIVPLSEIQISTLNRHR